MQLPKTGFTLVEMLVAVSALAIIAATLSPLFRNSVSRDVQNMAAERVVELARLAQHRSLAGLDDARWGLCVHQQEVWLYEETCTTDNAVESIMLAESVQISGVDDVLFDPAGRPNMAGTLLLTSPSGSNRIIFTETGGIALQ